MTGVQCSKGLFGSIGLIVQQLGDALHVGQNVLTAEFQFSTAAADTRRIGIVRHETHLFVCV